MVAAIRQFVRHKTNAWLFQMKDAEPGEVVLNRRRIFIVPTRPGLWFTVLLFMLLVGSINYSLGLGFALTFAIGACALVDMVFSYRNLAWLHLLPGRAQPVFAGEEASFELYLANPAKPDRYAVWIDFLQLGEPRHVCDVPAGGSASVALTIATTQRGWMRAPRVRLQTRFPLGLFRAWAYWQPDARVLVYPFPEPVAPPLPMSGVASQDGQGRAGEDDFAGIRSYQAGDPLRRLAWRQIARVDPALGGQLVTKSFEGGMVEELVLDFSLLPPTMELEARLSRMTRWVLDAEQRGLPYAFKLGAQQFAPSVGDAHGAACLRALALHGIEP